MQNINLPDLLNQYTPTELIHLQNKFLQIYLKEEISKKYFFSIINKINHKNILYLFKPEYLLYYILHSNYLQDIFIKHKICFLYTEMPKQKIPFDKYNTDFIPNTTDLKTPMQEFFSEVPLIYGTERMLNKRIKSILKVVFIIKQFYKLNPKNPSPKQCSKNILLSLLFNIDDCLLEKLFLSNEDLFNKNMTIKNFIKKYKLKPSKEDLKNQNVHYYNCVYNLLKSLEYKHLILFTCLQDSYTREQIKSFLARDSSSSSSSSNYIDVDYYFKNKFQMSKEYFLKNYKMFLLNEDVYYEYAIKEDIDNDNS